MVINGFGKLLQKRACVWDGLSLYLDNQLLWNRSNLQKRCGDNQVTADSWYFIAKSQRKRFKINTMMPEAFYSM